MAERSKEELLQEEQANKQLAEIEQLKRDYLATFSTPEGKRVLTHLEHICFIHKTTFVKGDEFSTIRNEGTRFIVVHIQNMMNMDIVTLKKLVRES